MTGLKCRYTKNPQNCRDEDHRHCDICSRPYDADIEGSIPMSHGLCVECAIQESINESKRDVDWSRITRSNEYNIESKNFEELRDEAKAKVRKLRKDTNVLLDYNITHTEWKELCGLFDLGGLTPELVAVLTKRLREMDGEI